MKMWFWKARENTATAAPYYTCESIATYANATIVSMKPCGSVKVSQGDQLIMESEYDASLAP